MTLVETEAGYEEDPGRAQTASQFMDVYGTTALAPLYQDGILFSFFQMLLTRAGKKEYYILQYHLNPM